MAAVSADPPDELSAKRSLRQVSRMAKDTQAACDHIRILVRASEREVVCRDCCKELDPFDVVLHIGRAGVRVER